MMEVWAFFTHEYFFFFVTSLPVVKSLLSDLILLNIELSALMSSGKITIFIKAIWKFYIFQTIFPHNDSQESQLHPFGSTYK